MMDAHAARLRARRSAAEPEWRFPSIGDFLHWRRVLAFDATLSHTGWACMEARPGGWLVISKGCINPATDKVSYLGTWDKAQQLNRELGDLEAWARCAGAVVVEAPSVGGGSRTESSLIAGLVISMRWPDKTVAISATHVSAVLLGDARVRSAERKTRIAAAVARLYPEGGTAGRGWNEHVRDGFATGAVYLYDQKQKEAA